MAMNYELRNCNKSSTSKTSVRLTVTLQFSSCYIWDVTYIISYLKTPLPPKKNKFFDSVQ